MKSEAMMNKQTKQWMGLIALSAWVSLISLRSLAVDSINGFEIAETTIACEDCVDWKVVGACFWLKCTLFSCKVKESPKIHQYNPDLLVATHTSPHSPIHDLENINPVESANLTNRDERSNPNDLETYVDFKHAEVLGNPAVLFFQALASTDWFCAPGVDIPYFPYYLSGVDKPWRNPDIENLFPQSWLGLPKISTNLPLGYWASVYPRCGWGTHPYDAINAAVAAHRAAAITTSQLAPHVYIRPNTNCGNRCWGPATVTQGNRKNHQFQMLFPKKSTSGMVMGGSARWANGKNAKLDEGYVWSLWRPYKCCKKKGQFFLFSIDWE